MKCCAQSLLIKCASIVEKSNDPHAKGYAFMLEELTKNMLELGQRNDLPALKEFIELYSL